MYKAVLKNEILGSNIADLNSIRNPAIKTSQSVNSSLCNQSDVSTKIIPNQISRSTSSVFEYSSSPNQLVDKFKISSMLYHGKYSPYSLTEHSQKLLRSSKKPARKIPRAPFKVLDAPNLCDDFYLNLVDWSSSNILGVGLGSSVYLWSATTLRINKLYDLMFQEDSVSSISWSEKSNFIAIGTLRGDVQIWDVETCKLFSILRGHSNRVGSLAWNNDLLCSGGRDKNLFLRDIRIPVHKFERKLVGHKQEICGLKWSPDKMTLASGGNDNRLLIWNINGNNTPMQMYTDHIAAVKGLAWSPHQHGLLASGGGTADKCIKFRNILTGQNSQSIDTGSQICNLAWSRHSNELLSTHGYSQNEISIWKYPNMMQLAKLTGHASRVLYLSMSPDGESIVTGAGDESLRFWNVFNKSKSVKVKKFFF